MSNGTTGSINWQSVAVWAILTLLAGAWAWLGADAGRMEDSIQRLNVATGSNRENVFGLQQVVPRIESRLDRIERQNEEILRELRNR